MFEWSQLPAGRALDKTVGIAAGWKLVQAPPYTAQLPNSADKVMLEGRYALFPPDRGTVYESASYVTPERAWGDLPFYSTIEEHAELLFAHNQPYDPRLVSNRFLRFWRDWQMGAKHLDALDLTGNAGAAIDLALIRGKRALAISYAYLYWKGTDYL